MRGRSTRVHLRENYSRAPRVPRPFAIHVPLARRHADGKFVAPTNEARRRESCAVGFLRRLCSGFTRSRDSYRSARLFRVVCGIDSHGRRFLIRGPTRSSRFVTLSGTLHRDISNATEGRERERERCARFATRKSRELARVSGEPIAISRLPRT